MKEFRLQANQTRELHEGAPKWFRSAKKIIDQIEPEYWLANNHSET